MKLQLILAACCLLASAIQGYPQDGGVRDDGESRQSESSSLNNFPFHGDFQLIEEEAESTSQSSNFIELQNGAGVQFWDAFKGVKEIGKGNYGTVYSAYAKKDGAAGLAGIRKGERVAIKKFAVASSLAKEKDVNEALKAAIQWTEDRLSQCTLRSAARPNIHNGEHNYIVTYRGMVCESQEDTGDEGLAEKQCYLVFSFFGKSALYNLYWRFKKSLYLFAPTLESHCDLKRVLNVANQVQEALRFLRGHGILHADVTPANILVDGRHFDRAKLIDFGVSRTFTDEDNTKSQLTIMVEFVKNVQAPLPRFDTLSNLINIERILEQCEKRLLTADSTRRAYQQMFDELSNKIPFDVGTANGFSTYLSVWLRAESTSLITDLFDSVQLESDVDCRPESIYRNCEVAAESQVNSDSTSHTRSFIRPNLKRSRANLKEKTEFLFTNCVKWVAHKCEIKNQLSLNDLKEVELIIQGCEYDSFSETSSLTI